MTAKTPKTSYSDPRHQRSESSSLPQGYDPPSNYLLCPNNLFWASLPILASTQHSIQLFDKFAMCFSLLSACSPTRVHSQQLCAQLPMDLKYFYGSCPRICNSKWGNMSSLDPGQKTLSKTVWSSSDLHNIEFTMYLRHGKQKKTFSYSSLYFSTLIYTTSVLYGTK